MVPDTFAYFGNFSSRHDKEPAMCIRAGSLMALVFILSCAAV